MPATTVSHIEEFLYMPLSEAIEIVEELELEHEVIGSSEIAPNRHNLAQTKIVFRVDQSNHIEEVIFHSDIIQ